MERCCENCAHWAIENRHTKIGRCAVKQKLMVHYGGIIVQTPNKFVFCKSYKWKLLPSSENPH